MRSVSRRKFLYGAVGTVAALTAADALWLEHFLIEWTHHYIGEADAESENISLVQISDLHLRKLSRRHMNLADDINSLKPSMLLLTGDVLDSNKNLYLLDEFLSLLDPGIKKVSILGNWECWEVNPLMLLDVYRKHHCELIVNHSFQYMFGNTSLSISGMDDYLGGKADFPMAMEFLVPSDYHIVLTHCPEHRDVIYTQKNDIRIDLVLSGHTHGGQLNIFGFAPIRPPRSGRYVSGWYRESDPPLYVSRGIGTSGAPVRFGSRAEVAVFYFKKVKERI